MQKGLNWYIEAIYLSATIQSHPLIQAGVVYFCVIYVVSFLPYQLGSMVVKYDFENKKSENNFEWIKRDKSKSPEVLFGSELLMNNFNGPTWHLFILLNKYLWLSYRTSS